MMMDEVGRGLAQPRAADFEGGSTKRKYVRAGIVRHESFPGKLKGGGVHAGGLKLKTAPPG